MDTKTKVFIISGLRKLTYKFPPRTAAKMKVRELASEHPEMGDLGRTKYVAKCATCGKYYKEADLSSDHILPVVPTEGYLSGLIHDWNEYLERMFCPEEGWQSICSDCHDKKTALENGERKNTRKSKKKLDK